MDDQLKRAAYRNMPAGHGIVREGTILPSDLIYSWTTKEWLRADDPEWGSHVVKAEDCVAVCRNAAANASRSSGRNYTVRRQGNDEPPMDMPGTSQTKPQTSLFK